MSHSDLQIAPFEQADEEEVIELWKQCCLVVPWNDPHHDIVCKMQVQPKLFLVGKIEGKVVASVMAGYDGHRGWMNYLGVDPEWQGKGFGRQIVEEAEKRIEALGCPKINLQIRTTNTTIIGFYEALGYKMDEVVSMGKRLHHVDNA